MPSPFPGMKSYLEQAIVWSSHTRFSHTRFIVAIADVLTPNLRLKYYHL